MKINAKLSKGAYFQYHLVARSQKKPQKFFVWHEFYVSLTYCYISLTVAYKYHFFTRPLTCFLLLLFTKSEKRMLLFLRRLLMVMNICPARLFTTRSSNCSYVSSSACSSCWKLNKKVSFCPTAYLSVYNLMPHSLQLPQWDGHNGSVV